MTKKVRNEVTVVQKTVAEWSKQVESDDFLKVDWIIEAPDFKSLERLHDESFLVPWVLEKIASSVGDNFVSDNEELLKKIAKVDHAFLNSAREFFGVAYFEVIRTKDKKVARLEPVITSTVRKLKYGWYVQLVWTKKVYFNDFIWNEDERNKQIKVFEWTDAKKNTLATDKKAWYNPDLNEIYAFSNPSITSKNYWHSLYISSIDQILLLSTIDTYFLNLFWRGWMNTSIISPKNEKHKFSVAWKKALQQFLLNNFNGVKNAWVSAILDIPIEKTNLSDEVDTKAFNEKTDELFKKVAIGLNIPYEVLLAVVWNKNTSNQAIENFNKQKVQPIQNRNLKDFKIIFEWEDKIDELEYVEIDMKDQLEEMKVITGYVKHGTISQEQARKQAWYEEPSEWDTFYSWKAEDEKDEDLESDNPDDLNNILKTIENEERNNLQGGN